MRYRKLLFTLILAITFTRLFAQTVDQYEAESAARNFMGYVTGSSVGRSAAKSIEQTLIRTYNGHNSYYIVKFSGGGYVILSSTENYEPILAFSEDDEYDETKLPPDYVWWMKGYDLKIDDIIVNNVQTTQYAQSWNDLRTPSSTARARGTPLLTSKWGQSGCIKPLGEENFSLTYNSQVNDGGRGVNHCSDGSCDIRKCPTGCVATATGQIMRYWGYPAFRFDWCNMPDSLNGAPTTVAIDAVADLLADIGVKVDMDYCGDSECSSGAFSEKAKDALRAYGYGANMRYKSLYPSWRQLIRDELDAGRPVYYTGDDSDGGHAWVIDDVDPGNDRRFHFNWGWEGWKNAYFYLEDGNEYNRHMSAIVNIAPDPFYCDNTLDLGEAFSQGENRNLPPGAGTVLSAEEGYPEEYRTVNDGTTARYKACDAVVLRPGFTASYGSDFAASVICNITRRADGSSRGRRSVVAAEKPPYTPTGFNLSEGPDQNSNEAVIVYPSPFSDKLHIKVNVTSNETLGISMYSAGGQNVFNVRERLVPGAHQLTYDLSAFSQGLYSIVVRRPHQTKIVRIVKK